MSHKKLYDSLKEADELHEIFSGMTGDWEKDKKRFAQLQTEMENISEEIIIQEYDEFS